MHRPIALSISLFLLIAAAATAPAAIKTVVFQNGIDGYSGALEAGLDMKSDTPVLKNNLWVGMEFIHPPENKTLPRKLLGDRQVLIRFDHLFGSAPGQIPPDAAIISATLSLRVPERKDAASDRRVFLHRMLLPWDKDALWKSPQWRGNGIQADNREAAAKADALFVPNHPAATYDIDITASLRAWAAGAPNHGWVLLETRKVEPNAAAFLSSNSQNPANRPRLSVTYDTDPSPPPSVTALSTTADGSAAVLSLSATSQAPGNLSVTFLGRRLPDASPDYKIVLLPDTQYYTDSRHGGTPEMLVSQMGWLAKNAKKLGVAFALHLGDITDSGDVSEDEWKVAAHQGLYLLEDPALTGLPEGLPYSPAVGNHDQRFQAAPGKIAWDGPAVLYEKYFGVTHFKNKSYHGGHHGETNHNHYMLFDAGTDKYIVVSLAFGFAKKNPGVLDWASQLLAKHAGRRAILVTHGALLPGIQGNFLPDGQVAYDALKKHPNLMLIVGGHVTGEGRRADTFEGRVVHSILMDFQHDDNAGVITGGNGFLGILTVSPRHNTIRVQTYSPYTNELRTDPAADYTLDHDFGAKIEPFQKLATTTAAAGATASFRWENLQPGAACEWRAEVSNGQKSTLTKPRVFEAPR
jgi:hypothetical protein